MSAAHTPGPWGLIVGDAGPIIFSGNTGNMVAQCVRGVSTLERQANARLIAAAPELLEALQNLLTFPLGTFQVAAARAAIAKATGEQ